jgi:pSer/pThr/pTyr-binding forkhead associated (FHA) protein
MTGEHAGQTFTVDGATMIGRDTAAKVRINDRSISRKHAMIEQRDDGFYVVDLGSQNGTRLNGATVTDSLLPASCRIQFGAVDTEFSLVSSDAVPARMPVADDSGWQQIPANGQVSLDDIFLRPASLEEIDQREAHRKAEAQKRILDLTYIAAMILILIVGVLAFVSLGKKSDIPQQTVILHRYTKDPTEAEGRGERLIPYKGKGRFARILVSDPDIAKVEQDDNYWWLLCVRGDEVGETKATMVSRSGEPLGILTIIVKGEAEEERLSTIDLPDSECIRRARQMVMQADYVRTESPWQALKLYERAAVLCKPLDPRPELYAQARARAGDLRKLIDKRARELKEEAYIARHKRAIAVKKLNDILRLIPDPDDKRHQRARTILYMHYPEMMRKPVRR